MRRLGGCVVIALMFFACRTMADTLLRQASVKWYSVGSSAVSEPTGVESMGVNPAGMVNASKQFISGYSSHFQNAFMTGIAGTTVPLSKTITVGLIGAIRRVDDIPESIGVGLSGTQVGSFSDTEVTGKLGIAVQLTSDWAMGAAVGGYNHSVYSHSGSQWSVDFGTQYDFKFVKLGMSLQNIGKRPVEWTTGKKDQRPMEINVGLSKKIGPVVGMVSATQVDAKTACNIGVVLEVWDHLVITGGVQNVFDDWSGAVGVDLKLESFSLIYSYGQSTELGETHKLGLEVGI